MARLETKVCLGCEETKPVSEYGKTASGKPVARCKKCIAAYQRKRTAERTKTRVITSENKVFFHLGLLEGDDRLRDMEKALNIMEKANRALLEVVREADLRDSKRRKVPA